MRVKLKVPIKSKAKFGIFIHYDTRETLPLRFPKDPMIVGVKRIKLDVGDYRGFSQKTGIGKLVFERKSIADLWGTMTKGHNRFMREHERALDSGIKLVVIVERPFCEILTGFHRSIFAGTAMVKKLWTMRHKYGIETVFCKGREDMADYISWALICEFLHQVKKG